MAENSLLRHRHNQSAWEPIQDHPDTAGFAPGPAKQSTATTFNMPAAVVPVGATTVVSALLAFPRTSLEGLRAAVKLHRDVTAKHSLEVELDMRSWSRNAPATDDEGASGEQSDAGFFARVPAFLRPTMRRLWHRAKSTASQSSESLAILLSEDLGIHWGLWFAGLGTSMVRQFVAGTRDAADVAALSLLDAAGKAALSGSTGEYDEGAQAAAAASMFKAAADSRMVPASWVACGAWAAGLTGIDPGVAALLGALVALLAVHILADAAASVLEATSSAAFVSAEGARAAQRRRRFVRAIVTQDVPFLAALPKLPAKHRPQLRDADAVSDLVLRAVPNLVNEVFSAVRFAVLITLIDWRLGLLSFVLGLPDALGWTWRASTRVSMCYDLATQEVTEGAEERFREVVGAGTVDNLVALQQSAQEEPLARSVAGSFERSRLLRMVQPFAEKLWSVGGSAFSDVCSTLLRSAAAVKMVYSLRASASTSGPGVAPFGFATLTALDRFAKSLQYSLRGGLPRRWESLVKAQDSLRRYAFFRYRVSSVRVAVQRGELLLDDSPEGLHAVPEVLPPLPPPPPAVGSLLGMSREPSTALAEPEDEAAAPSIPSATTGGSPSFRAIPDATQNSQNSWCLVAVQPPTRVAEPATSSPGPPRWFRTRLRGGYHLQGVAFSYPPRVDILAEMVQGEKRRGGGHAVSSASTSPTAPPSSAEGASKAPPVVLSGFDLRIPAGATVGVCGASGCGKSTLLKLLTRFYEPSGGYISLDGRPLADYAPRSLRRACGWVPQKPSIVAGLTVRANILLGLEAQFGMPPSWDAAAEELRRVRREALIKGSGTAKERAAAASALPLSSSTKEEQDGPVPGQAAAEAAARAARIHDEITAMALGYDTVLEEGTLSGGQVQRLAIARALARQPALLLLDEFSAALDPPAEREVLASINAARIGRTTVIVAHRMTTIEHADFVVFVQDGRVAELGSYRDLLAREGAFARFVGETQAEAASP